MKNHALITGITGQDGAYLAKFLLDKGYQVYGTFRRLSTPNFWRLQHLGISNSVNLIPADLLDAGSMVEAIRLSEPDEIYNLAAQSFVGASFEEPVATAEISGVGVVRILDAIRQLCPHVKLYQASTSEMFGNLGQDKEPIAESVNFKPVSPYAAAKVYGHYVTRIYREAYGIFACNGILFNHESPLRGLEFVTRKISNGVAKIALGLSHDLRLGNLNSRRDWGYAPEYVESMWMMLQQDQPDDYIIATGESHTVSEVVEMAFKEADLDWREYVKIDNALFRPLDVDSLCGDYSKASKKFGWRPRTGLPDLVRLMVKEDISRWRRHLKGETFPWDAPSYPDEMRVLTRSTQS